LIGEILDEKYRIISLLGQGGMGSVYEAEQLDSGQRVALKRIEVGIQLRSNTGIARFQREAKATGKIDTDHIVRVLDAKIDPATKSPYLVMELLEGQDLQQLLDKVGALDPRAALRITAQVCLGLQKAHDARVIHRDIKPANLFLARRGGGELTVKILDFGIAKIKPDPSQGGQTTGLTRTGGMLGSPLYMSPEQARGLKEIDFHTDIWSLGVVLYRALSGHAPHGDIDAFGDLIMAICSTSPRPIQDLAPWIPPEVAAIVHRALRLDANERFPTAAAMLAAIQPLLPDGWALRDELLVPVQEATRALIAPRLSMQKTFGDQDRHIVRVAAGGRISHGSASTDELPPSNLGDEAARHEPASASTTTAESTVSMRDGEVTSRSKSAGAPWSRAGRTAPVIAGVSVAVGLGVFGMYKMSTPPENRSFDAVPANAVAPVERPAAPDPRASSTPLHAPAPTLQRVKLTVVPSDVSVEVEGKPARVEGGELEIEGTLGSIHHVRLFKGKDERKGEVIVTEAGASPPSMELEVGKPKPAGKPSAKAPAGPAATATGKVAPPQTASPGNPLIPEKFN
jgi:serine/threonine protein kinase